MKKFAITEEFLVENNIPKLEIEWFLYQGKKSMTIKQLKKYRCDLEWVAEYLYNAGKNWDDEKYTEEIAKALIETGDAFYLYLTGMYWDDSRYIKGIARALAKTKNAVVLYEAGKNWKDSRYIDKIRKALFATGDKAFLNLARQKWDYLRYANL